MNMTPELYFCMELTENEHYIFEDSIRKKWPNLRVIYYRQLKDGHIPMYREIKLAGNQSAILAFKRWMVSEKHSEFVKRNPYSVAKESGPFICNHVYVNVE